MREGGSITLVHRADRLGDILGGLASKAGSIRIRPIQPFADQPAKRVLVRAVKTGNSTVTQVQIVSGLADNDAVALPSEIALKSGDRVTPVQ